MALLGILLVLSPTVLGDDPGLKQEATLDELNSLGLQDLLDVEVVSVSKKSESLSGVAAAVAVVTQEDIRRSGAESLPEALRLVPGLDVERFDSNKWAVSARGFSAIHSNKLLVLIDGRSVYLPAISGVYWGHYDIDLEEIERIEVIRGPGGAVWGANAVNGVINIITKRAHAEDGGSVSVAFGDFDPRWRATVRHSGQIGSSAEYRVYAKGARRGPSGDAKGGDAADELTDRRIAARVDWTISDRTDLMIQAGVHDSESDAEYMEIAAVPQLQQPLTTQNIFKGGHLLGRLDHRSSEYSATTVQFYADYTESDIEILGDELLRLDLDVTHRWNWGGRHTLIGGLGYRRDSDRIIPSLTISSTDPKRELDLASAFIQDEIRAYDDRLRVTAGVKFVHNSFTGLETQPSLRFAWQGTPHRTVWAALSRAVRTPSRESDDFRVNARVLPTPSLPLLVSTFGNPDLQAEYVVAAEAGYRTHLGENATFDAAIFYNRYHDLIDYSPGEIFFEMSELPPHLVLPAVAQNSVEATSKGAELALGVEIGSFWQMRLAYSHLDLEYNPSTTPTPGENPGLYDSGQDPEHQASLRVSYSPSGPWRVDGILRYVSERPAHDLDSRLTMDLVAAVTIRENSHIELVARNMLEEEHLEYTYFFFGALATEVRPSWMLRARWGF